jgi:hypothetical protein
VAMTNHLRPPIANGQRRFACGLDVEVSGLGFRIVPGSKVPGDLILQWRTPGGWRHIRLDALGLLADFFYENEHWLYPPPANEGGEYVRRFLGTAVSRGWECAASRLHEERERAAARRAATNPEGALP